jgi:tetratricopeptide (TPR) repeat protein
MGILDRFKSAQRWYNQGVKLAQQGKYEESLDYFDKALERNPKLDIALNSRGLILEKLKRYQEYFIIPKFSA